MEPSVGCIRVCGLLMFGACARSVSAGTCVYGLENLVREIACVVGRLIPINGGGQERTGSE
jgi:hypothetical protein